MLSLLSPSATTLLPIVSRNFSPALRPSLVANQIAQSKERVKMRLSPAHASLFHAVLDDHFVTTFDRTRANRIVLGAKMRIVNLLKPCFEIAVLSLKSSDFCFIGQLSFEET